MKKILQLEHQRFLGRVMAKNFDAIEFGRKDLQGRDDYQERVRYIFHALRKLNYSYSEIAFTLNQLRIERWCTPEEPWTSREVLNISKQGWLTMSNEKWASRYANKENRKDETRCRNDFKKYGSEALDAAYY